MLAKRSVCLSLSLSLSLPIYLSILPLLDRPSPISLPIPIRSGSNYANVDRVPLRGVTRSIVVDNDIFQRTRAQIVRSLVYSVRRPSVFLSDSRSNITPACPPDGWIDRFKRGNFAEIGSCRVELPPTSVSRIIQKQNLARLHPLRCSTSPRVFYSDQKRIWQSDRDSRAS